MSYGAHGTDHSSTRHERTAFTLQVTERCNLACTYCYVRERPTPASEDCSPQLCRDFIDFALTESAAQVKITFFGGEPLLRPDLISYTVDYGRERAQQTGKAIRFHVITNGTLLQGALCDLIADRDISLEISIDGPEPIHDLNRRYPDGTGSFQQTYANLVRFRECHPTHHISIFSVLTDMGSIPWLYSVARDLGIAEVTLNPIHLSAAQEACLGEPCLSRNLSVSTARLQSHQEQFLQGIAGSDRALDDEMTTFLRQKVLKKCSAGFNTTITVASGEIYPCPLFVGYRDQIIGDVFNGFYPDKTLPYLERTTESIKPCSQCAVRNFCGGGCLFRAYQKNGSINTPCSEFCATQRDYVDRLQGSLISLAAKKPEAVIRKYMGPLALLRFHYSSMKDGENRPSKQTRPSIPSRFVIELTEECNLSCTYCYNGRKAQGHHLQQQTACAILEYIAASPCREPLLSLFGGEPLLNWSTARFLIETFTVRSAECGKTPHFHIVTNGTLVTRAIAKVLADHQVTVQISIDGTRDGHSRHRKCGDGSASYDAVLRGVDLLRQADQDLNIDAQVVITPDNMNMIHIAEHLKEAGFRRVHFLMSVWPDSQEARWSRDDIMRLIRMREDFFPFFMECAIGGSPDIDFGFAAIVSCGPNGPKQLCECSKDEIYFDVNGNIYPCALTRSSQHLLGTCFSSPPAEGVQLPRATASLDIGHECTRCWAYSRCKGGCLFVCQRCPLLPQDSRHTWEELWCELMRAEFARAVIAYQILAQHHPEALMRLRSMFRYQAHG